MTFWSYAEPNLFYLCLSFTSTCLKFLSFIQTADTPAHHHNSLIFFQCYQEGKILNKHLKFNYFSSVPMVQLRLCKSQLHLFSAQKEKSWSVQMYQIFSEISVEFFFLLNPVGNSFCWKHLHVSPQVCPLQNSTAAHKHAHSSAPDLK